MGIFYFYFHKHAHADMHAGRMEKTSKLIEFHSSNWLILCSANDVFNLEICAGGTQFQSNDVSKTAFTTLLLAVSPNYLLF